MSNVPKISRTVVLHKIAQWFNRYGACKLKFFYTAVDKSYLFMSNSTRWPRCVWSFRIAFVVKFQPECHMHSVLRYAQQERIVAGIPRLWSVVLRRLFFSRKLYIYLPVFTFYQCSMYFKVDIIVIFGLIASSKFGTDGLFELWIVSP